MTSLSVGVTVVGLLILGQSEDPDAKVDLRTPEAALRSFYGALAKGDVKTAQAAVRANEPEINGLRRRPNSTVPSRHSGRRLWSDLATMVDRFSNLCRRKPP